MKSNHTGHYYIYYWGIFVTYYFGFSWCEVRRILWMVPKGKLSYVKSRRLEFPPLWTPFKCHKGNPLKFKPSTTAWEIGENLKQLQENEWALAHSILYSLDLKIVWSCQIVMNHFQFVVLCVQTPVYKTHFGTLILLFWPFGQLRAIRQNKFE